MSVPDDAKTVRGLLDRCQEAMQLTGDTETVKRLEDYAERSCDSDCGGWREAIGSTTAVSAWSALRDMLEPDRRTRISARDYVTFSAVRGVSQGAQSKRCAGAWATLTETMPAPCEIGARVGLPPHKRGRCQLNREAFKTSVWIGACKKPRQPRPRHLHPVRCPLRPHPRP